MSRFQSTRRRISLLTSSSLVAAGLTAAMSVGIAFTPAAAFAANECTPEGVDPSVNLSLPDNYVCDAGFYGSGVTYDSDGNLVVEASSFDVGAEGVRLTGHGADSVTFDAGFASINAYENTGPAIQVLTDSGDIFVEVGGVAGVGVGGISAISDDGGNVTVNAGQLYFIPGTSIEAISRGGDGDVTINASGLFPTERGVYGESSGAGDLTINMNSFLEAYGPGTVGVEAVTTGSGLLTVNVGSEMQSSVYAEGTSVRTSAGGNAVINVFSGSSVSTGVTGNPSLDLGVASGTTTTVNLAAGIGEQGGGSFNGLTASGAGALVINNDGVVRGAFDLSGLMGGLEMSISDDGVWHIPNYNRGLGADYPQSVVLTSGRDVVTSSGRLLGGWVSISFPVPAGQEMSLPTVVDFGEGDDAFVNQGDFAVQFVPAGNNNKATRIYKAETRFLGLETFTHSGWLWLGATGMNPSDLQGEGELKSDGWFDDALIMPGTRWVGDGGQVVFDVNLNATAAQANCTDRTAGGDLVAADCISLIGGSTEGVTYATIIDANPGDRGVYIPEGHVLVDVSGDGEGGHQGDFVLSPETVRYSEVAGGVIDKGLFFYAIAYDEEDKQHKLFGLPGPNVLQFPLLATAAQGLWRVSTGTWSDRQADLRGSDLEDGYGLWLRASGEFANRDLIQTVEAIGNTYAFDNTYEQTSYAVTGGLDLLTGGAGDTTYVVGLMAGYAHTQMEYEHSPNTASMDGWTGGAYASFLSGPFFVDAAINANKLIVKEEVPGLGLLPEGTILDTDLLSVGGVVEAGWRWSFMEGAFIEPLAAVSYVRTTYEDMKITQSDPLRPASTVEYDDPTSLRASIGARLGLDQGYGGMRAQYFLLGRLWNEFEGENGVILHNAGPDALAVDDFSGQFTEFGMGASLYSAGGGVSGFLNVGGKFAEDYNAVNGTAGVRVNW